MVTRILMASLLIVSCVVQSNGADSYKAGAAKIVITPETGIWMAGLCGADVPLPKVNITIYTPKH